MQDRNFTHSMLGERIVEHVFVGDVLRTLWRHGVTDVEILRPEFDAHGYDLVISRGPVVWHIQLKTQAGQSIGSQCFGREAERMRGLDRSQQDTLELGPFMWFGGSPGKRLPDISAHTNPKRATHSAEGVRPLRKNHDILPTTAFTKLMTLDEVIVRLFGEVPVA